MTLEPQEGVDDLLARRCAVCGATLTSSEIETAREEGRPFLCTVHAMEELPAEDVGESGDAA